MCSLSLGLDFIPSAERQFPLRRCRCKQFGLRSQSLKLAGCRKALSAARATAPEDKASAHIQSEIEPEFDTGNISVLQAALSEAQQAADAAKHRVLKLEKAISEAKNVESEAQQRHRRQAAGAGGPVKGPLAARRKLSLAKRRKQSTEKEDDTKANSPEVPPSRPQLTPPDVKRTAGDFEDIAQLQHTDKTEVHLSYETMNSSFAEQEEDNETCKLPKPVYVISDCTGESAAKTVRAALGQFENCIQASVPANMVIFRFLNDTKKAVSIVERAAADNALVVYTLVDPVMVDTLKAACKFYNVRWVDLWGNLLDSMEEHLQTMRSGVPLGASDRKHRLTRDYFKLISAVEYTRKMDDGAHPENWKECDLMILGVSRSGKTPLCIYLGQRGYKVANLPLVPGLTIPKQLHEIDQRKIVGLIMDAKVLHAIRTNRMESMGVKGVKTDYVQLNKVREELTWVKDLYEANPDWLVVDQTYRSVEETAARILREMSDRLGDEHPMWSEEVSGEMVEITAGSLSS
uniref:Uncharacterized protein n=1 Tax=Tetraselmis sp. GSL018 TaxID=582737 RepID=A0A061R513_9CHLO|eukprot:CAMPEP_0177602800 /NCGR_PEP_ID=MMETSP0419_2-20121207/15104_1 /TAXON_ID=582737 /ORGANISM="Tetraselmis sp., Strain GSL018" /LENGTH=517 /DNA_ID=CAMNT_0019096393 /DNA_START=26 /DNA_END=1579 /DNA_ORIENTATION=+